MSVSVHTSLYNTVPKNPQMFLKICKDIPEEPQSSSLTRQHQSAPDPPSPGPPLSPSQLFRGFLLGDIEPRAQDSIRIVCALYNSNTFQMPFLLILFCCGEAGQEEYQAGRQ